jgi:hypothetical protein
MRFTGLTTAAGSCTNTVVVRTVVVDVPPSPTGPGGPATGAPKSNTVPLTLSSDSSAEASRPPEKPCVT